MKIIFALLSYFVGSIPTGYVIFWLSEKKDIRNIGSQSTGATNILRTKGWKYAIPVGVVDVLKGFLPVFMALRLFPEKNFALACGFVAVLGHCFPVYIKFKGGKGIATSTGVFAAIALKPLLSALVLFLLVVFITRYVSLGSMLGALSIPFFAYVYKEPVEYIYLSFAVIALIIFKHRSNIARLVKGNERKFGKRI